MKLRTEELFDYVKSKVDNNESITVKVWSEYFNYDYSYFSRSFKKNIGISPATYITAVKMEKTLENLLLENRSVTDSYSSVQYQSASSFSRNFKKYMGQGPEEFKKKAYELSKTIDEIIKKEEPLELTLYDKSREADFKKMIKPLSVEVKLPDDRIAPLVFVGIYEKPIALGNPMVGKALFYSNKCVFENVPRGKYYIFVSVIEKSTKKEDYFFARKLLKGCTLSPVTFPEVNNVIINVREPKNTDLPSVINFAKLVENNFEDEMI